MGYHFERGYRWPRKKRLRKLKDAVREKTRRTSGKSLGEIIRDVNRTLVGWFKTSSIATKPHFRRSTAGYGCACGPFCANVVAVVGAGAEVIINAGQMSSLPNMGCSH
ncbi:MAG: hypothetical protein HYV63_00235 [Candidatus Schekmanbacteria bacterium]|nr:hypothetical protein [Candidatus Schekmanbacteria bacterium]